MKVTDCSVNAECIDVNPGRHFCVCKAGYIGDGKNCDGIGILFVFVFFSIKISCGKSGFFLSE